MGWVNHVAAALVAAGAGEVYSAPAAPKREAPRCGGAAASVRKYCFYSSMHCGTRFPSFVPRRIGSVK